MHATMSVSKLARALIGSQFPGAAALNMSPPEGGE
jgi:hypothetical protein